MESRNWHSWIDTMPPKPHKFYITGEVYIDTIEVKPQLFFKEPQGINDSIILVDLQLAPLHQEIISKNSWIPCRLEKALTTEHTMYKRVQIFYKEDLLADIDVKITS